MIPTIPVLLGAWGRLVARHGGPVAAIVVLLTAAGVLIDMLIPNDTAAAAANFGFSIAATVAESWLTLRMLEATPGYDARESRPRVVGLIVLGIPVTLAVGAGLLLLVLPGLYLAARWIAAAPILIGEDTGVGEAMGRSWRLTQRAAPAIAACFALMAAPLALAFVVIAMTLDQPLTAGWSLLFNLLFVLTLAGEWVLGIAAYLLLRESPAADGAVV
ncbi:glycerophosphoryl diester phosphodiesterase membrane domain-containing protein [Sphingomonas sp. DT-204]|uniref:glycerophosphoryl diester phosphodiesterase membrane domain-containing protein n=1 Tax=Sphingomonas sp. DT-204 TaxID=3396166 RepID=UPI003F1DBB42